MRNPNRLITREMAESHIWNYDFEGTSRTWWMYISAACAARSMTLLM